jgi:predicted CopG family antitoxin
MGSKNITVTEEAYERLKAHKREGESFTDVVLRLSTQERDVWDGYGAFRSVDGFRDAVQRGKETFDQDFDERQRRLFGQNGTSQ